MKKRMIIFSSLISLLALLALYAISLGLISNENKNKAIEEINIYLDVATSHYENENFEDVANYMVSLDDNLRITFIDLTGKVVYDSELKYQVDNLDNHLNRPEIMNLGEAIIRKSGSTNDKMMYIARLIDDYYLRVSFDTVYFTTGNVVFAVGALLSIIIIYLIILVFLYLLSKRMLKPIEKEINDLALIADAEVVFKADTIDKLPEVIEAAKVLINNKLRQIKEENTKNETIIQAIDECLILLKNEIVTLVNDQTLKAFNVTKEAIIGKNYLYLFRNTTLLNAIKNAIDTRKNEFLNINMSSKNYSVSIIPFNSCQVLVSLKDITEKQQMEVIKKDFFANASHELKSPLTTIIGYEQMILNGIIEDKKEIKDASLKILKEANRMNQIIIDMLELSNLEFSKTYELVDIKISDVLYDVINRYQSRIDNKNINLSLDIKDTTLYCNKEQIETLFSNLIDNAIKYNKENGSIILILDEKHFVCKDTGIGISYNDQSRVFERFYRVDKAKSKETGGTGLGLAIVKHICEKFNYKVELESVLDVGTAITIYFE